MWLLKNLKSSLKAASETVKYAWLFAKFNFTGTLWDPFKDHRRSLNLFNWTGLDWNIIHHVSVFTPYVLVYAAESQFWAGLSLHRKCIWSVSSRERLDIISYLSWLYGASFDKHQSLFVYLHWLEGVLMHNNDIVCVCMHSYVSMCVLSPCSYSHLLSLTPYLIFCRRTTVTNLTLPPGTESVCVYVCVYGLPSAPDTALRQCSSLTCAAV